MQRAIRAEVQKLLTTRLWWGMAVALLACGAVFAAVLGVILNSSVATPESGIPEMTPLQVATSTYTGGVGFGYLFLMVIGIMTIGAEYRHKTITATLLAFPKRSTMIVAKVVALLGFGVFYGLVFLAGSVVTGAIILSARGLDAFPQPGTLTRSLLLVLLVLGLWALIGLGLGVMIPNQITSILVGVGIASFLEPILAMIGSSVDWGKDVVKFFPSQATTSVLGGWSGNSDSATPTLTWWQGSLTLLAYAVIFVAIGAWLTNKRDVT